ncbi:MAG: O-antigen ligase family protein, partial [Solirubrobacteraceae bacterium]
MGRIAARRRAGVIGGLLLAALLVALAPATSGGFGPTMSGSSAHAWAEITITLGGAGTCMLLLFSGVRGLGRGTAPAALFAVLAGLTALSILWSVQPDGSWQAANLTVAYLLAFLAAIAAARMFPGRWRSVVAGLGLAMVSLCLYGLLSKVFPGTLAASQADGRLAIPFGYWNAAGAAAVIGLAPCQWLWQRRDTGAWARALAVPGAAVLLTVTVLSYSRTSLIVAVIVIGAWLALVPGRLRSVALIALAGAGAAVMARWALARPALTGDNIDLAARTSAGHAFGIVSALTLIALTAAGWALVTRAERRPLTAGTRRRLEILLLVGLALLPVAVIGAVASSSRGLTGEISHAWTSLTSTSVGVGNGAGRVTQLGSSRPLYWSEGITVGEHALLKGVGALGYATARTRYTLRPEITSHAHSYLVQTFADLGLIGLLVNLALLIAWGRCAVAAIGRRPTAPRGPPDHPTPDRELERDGLVTLAIVVLAFGISSAADWTFFFPAVTVPALLAAGWLAGRGRPDERAERPTRRVALTRRPGTAAAITAIAALALVASWLIWQPLRSAQAANAAEAAAIRGDSATAFVDAHDAQAADPLALQPLLLLYAFDRDVGDLAGARRELLAAVALQPENANSWLQLGSFD